MTGTKFLKRVGAVVVALAAIATATADAKSASAKLGTVSAAGSPTSGGVLSYQFDLDVITSNAGPLVVKATVTGKKFHGKFPLLTIASPPVGISSNVPGTSVTVPTNFTGVAVMHVTAKYGRKNIGSKTLRVTITSATNAVPTGSFTVTTNLYDVGFENSVTLDSTIVPTSDLAGTVTYAWTQTSGKAVALSTNGLVSTSFTTDALTNFVDIATTTAPFVNDLDDSGYTNVLYVPPEHRFGTVSGVSIDNQQASDATYGFKVLVSNGSITRTGVFTVACALQTPAHPNIPVGVTAFYKGATNSMNWSLVSQPAGSVATLTHTNGLIAELRPDVQGVYVIQDNVTGTTVTNTAASWTGVQFCAICHGPGNNVGQADMVTPWSQTEHASMAQRGIDGALGSFYNQSCLQCHTVGYNQSPAAASNNNFYAVQQQVGWKFPAVLQAGNYALMPAQLQGLANIQCENCHGPGSRHPGSPSISSDERVCASCHQDGTHHVYPQQWEISPHAGAYESLSDEFGNRSNCSRCHSPAGFISVANGQASAGITNAAGLTAVATNAGPATCQVCHDPHTTFGDTTGTRHQLRRFDTVQLGNPLLTNSPTIYVSIGDNLTTANLQLTNSTITVTNAGTSATCMACHNAREWPTQIQVSGSGTNKMYYQTTAPSMSTAGEVFSGMGAYDYGQEMGNSFHTYLAKCQTCHMYTLRAPSGGVAQDTLAFNGVVSNVTTAVYDQYASLLGSHTFSMDYESVDVTGATNDVDDIAACNQCHATFGTVNSFDFQPANFQNYDGNTNSVVEGIQTQTQGLLNNLGFLLQTTGVTVSTNTLGNVISVSSSAGYSATNAVLQAAQRKAAWNWNLEYHEGSMGVHNTQFTIRLLQTSYTDLSTNYYGDETRTYQSAYPNAVLR